jgi:hypothetical protein
VIPPVPTDNPDLSRLHAAWRTCLTSRLANSWKVTTEAAITGLYGSSFLGSPWSLGRLRAGVVNHRCLIAPDRYAH